jgi:hypothetical protein
LIACLCPTQALRYFNNGGAEAWEERAGHVVRAARQVTRRIDPEGLRDVALVYRLMINLARQGCTAALPHPDHAMLAAWVWHYTARLCDQPQAMPEAMADIVVTMATHPLLQMDPNQVCAHRCRAVLLSFVLLHASP